MALLRQGAARFPRRDRLERFPIEPTARHCEVGETLRVSPVRSDQAIQGPQPARPGLLRFANKKQTAIILILLTPLVSSKETGPQPVRNSQ